MATIQEIRKKYPEYNDMSDEQLANSMHSKFYSDMPKEKFYNSIGYQSKEPQKIGKLQSFIGASEAAKENTLYGLQDVYQDVKSALGYENPEAKQELQEKIYQNRQKQEMYRRANPWSALGGDIFGGIVANAPLAAVPGIGQGAISRGVSSPVLRNIGIGISQGATQAGIEGALQPTLNNESRTNNALIYGLTGGLIGGGTSGILSGAQELQPSRLLRGEATDQQLAKNLRTARGTQTSLGGVLENPTLAKFEQNVLSSVPFSGVQQSNQLVNNQINSMAQDLLKNVSNPSASKVRDIPESLQRQLIKSEKEIRKESNNLYKKYLNMADKEGIIVDPQQLKAISQELYTDATTRSILDKDPKLLADAIKYSKMPSQNESISVDKWIEEPQNLEYMDFVNLQNKSHQVSTMDALKSELGEKAWKARLSGERDLSRKYLSFQNALESDIEKALTSKNVPEIETAREVAKRHYKEDVVPTKNKLVQKYINDPTLQQSENIIKDFVKFGNNQDRAKLMQKLTMHLDPKSMEYLRYAILSGAGEDEAASAMSKAFKGLGPKQRTQLFSGVTDLLPEWERITELRRLNPESISPMANPLTGQRLLSVAGTSVTAGLGALFGGPAGAATALAIESAAGYGLNKLLRNEKFREKLVNEMLKGPKNYDNLNSMISSSLAKYVPLAANQPSAERSKSKNRKEVIVETKGEY